MRLRESQADKIKTYTAIVVVAVSEQVQVRPELIRPRQHFEGHPPYASSALILSPRTQQLLRFRLKSLFLMLLHVLRR